MEEDAQIKQIGPYNISKVLGRGGMAIVYQGYQPSLNRNVAIKVMLGHFANDQASQERFQREAQAIARLRHPNILTIYEYGHEKGIPYIVTELLEGGTLRERIGKPVDLQVANLILTQISSALDLAHRRSIIHRDVKPSNILIDQDHEDRFVLSDFGIIKLLEEQTHLTAKSAVIGTPDYMSPEQFSGEIVDSRCDQYSLGVVLFELLTGVRPFKGESLLALMVSHKENPVPDPRQFNPLLSADVVDVLNKVLSKKREDRYSTVSEFARAFEKAITGKSHVLDTGATQSEIITGDTQVASRQVNIGATTISNSVARQSPYTILATAKGPALIIYLLDLSASMIQPLGQQRRLDVIKENLKATVDQMIFRSTRGGRISPRYRISILGYSDEVEDLLGGIHTLDKIANVGLPELNPLRTTDTAKAFLEVERILKGELELHNLSDSPAPVICHMTDGEYTGADPEPIVKRIMQMKVPDGNVLVENIFISDKILANPVDDITSWPGIQPGDKLLNDYALKLSNISSPLPDSYRAMMMEYDYHLKPGALMLLPGSSPELVAMGFQMSAATPVR